MKCDLCGKYMSEVDLAQDSALCADCHKNVFEKNMDQVCQPEKDEGRPWTASIGFFVRFIIIGIIVLFALPINRSDWFGVGFIVNVALLIVLGASICLVSSLPTIINGRRLNKSSRIMATLSLMILIIFFICLLLIYYADKW